MGTRVSQSRCSSSSAANTPRSPSSRSTAIKGERSPATLPQRSVPTIRTRSPGLKVMGSGYDYERRTLFVRMVCG